MIPQANVLRNRKFRLKSNTMFPAVPSSLAWAHPLVQEWFVSRFGTPTEPQEQGWPHILAGHTTLISAPTGSGKTLAAFLACIDRLVRKALAGQLSDRTEVLYISPLKALGNDIQKNLEIPLGEILQMAGERGLLMPEIRTAVRTGDTLGQRPAADAEAAAAHPGDDAGVVLHSAHRGEEPRGSARCGNRDRRRDSRGGRRQARSASIALARAAGGSDRATSGPHWTFRHTEADRRSGAISCRLLGCTASRVPSRSLSMLAIAGRWTSQWRYLLPSWDLSLRTKCGERFMSVWLS